MKQILPFLLFFLVLQARSQDYLPVNVSGFNEDVVAEGGGNSSLVATTREMDAANISNYVFCTREFADANSFTPAATYGLPNEGTFETNGRTYQMAPFSELNSLYLLPGDSGTLVLDLAQRFTDLSLLGLATEGNSQIKITFHFTDGTSQTETRSLSDWFAPNASLFQGYGRVKRKDGPFFNGVDFEAGGLNPKFQNLDFQLPCTKNLKSIGFLNTAPGVGSESFRAFIFAVAGKEREVIPTIRIAASDTVICPGTPVSFTSQITNGGTPQYTWKINSTIVGFNPTFSSSGLQNGDKVTCTLLSNAVCAFPLSPVSNVISFTVKPRYTPRVRIDGADDDYCQGDSAELLADTLLAGPIRIEWFRNGIRQQVNGIRYMIRNLQPNDSIRCQVYSLADCRTQDSATSNLRRISVQPKFPLSLEAVDSVYVDGNPIVLNGLPIGGTYSGLGVSDSLFDPAIAKVGLHTVQYAFNDNPCIEPVTRQIRVLKKVWPCEAEPFTFLSPNEDGKNDIWWIGDFNVECVSKAVVRVFNRWGSEVYSNDNYQNDWSAKDLGPGCYFFRVEYKGFGSVEGKVRNGVLVVVK